MEKLHPRNRIEVAVYAVGEGLVDYEQDCKSHFAGRLGLGKPGELKKPAAQNRRPGDDSDRPGFISAAGCALKAAEEPQQRAERANAQVINPLTCPSPWLIQVAPGQALREFGVSHSNRVAMEMPKRPQSGKFTMAKFRRIARRY